MTPDLSYEHLKLRLALAHLQLHEARRAIELLLRGGDPPDVAYADAEALRWLTENVPTEGETMNAFGALLLPGDE